MLADVTGEAVSGGAAEALPPGLVFSPVIRLRKRSQCRAGHPRLETSPWSIRVGVVLPPSLSGARPSGDHRPISRRRRSKGQRRAWSRPTMKRGSLLAQRNSRLETISALASEGVPGRLRACSSALLVSRISRGMPRIICTALLVPGLPPLSSRQIPAGECEPSALLGHVDERSPAGCKGEAGAVAPVGERGRVHHSPRRAVECARPGRGCPGGRMGPHVAVLVDEESLAVELDYDTDRHSVRQAVDAPSVHVRGGRGAGLMAGFPRPARPAPAQRRARCGRT